MKDSTKEMETQDQMSYGQPVERCIVKQPTYYSVEVSMICDYMLHVVNISKLHRTIADSSNYEIQSCLY